ncbi:MAG TPA: PH domain-containing protein [Caulobacteraceae bacterium]|nr:PH domain-containing protein [Caulobacteraceae bacterium]
MGYAERVLQPGETIAYRARLHWVIYLAGMVLVVVAIAAAIAALLLKTDAARYGLLLAAVIALFLGVFQMTRAWLWQVNTEITVTNRRIIYKRGFISRNTVEMNLDKVESVLVQQTLVGRMLDYGTVIVRGVGAGLEPVRLISHPLDLHRHVSAPAPT